MDQFPAQFLCANADWGTGTGTQNFSRNGSSTYARQERGTAGFIGSSIPHRFHPGCRTHRKKDPSGGRADDLVPSVYGRPLHPRWAGYFILRGSRKIPQPKLGNEPAKSSGKHTWRYSQTGMARIWFAWGLCRLDWHPT